MVPQSRRETGKVGHLVRQRVLTAVRVFVEAVRLAAARAQAKRSLGHIDHFDAECWFDTGEELDVPPLPELPPVLDLDPESLAPVPLFQGKFFRRIQSVRVFEDGKRSLTDIRVPNGERYFACEVFDRPVTGCPAILDSYLQSGALILPPGCLPRSPKFASFASLRPRIRFIAKLLSTRPKKTVFVSRLIVAMPPLRPFACCGI